MNNAILKQNLSIKINDIPVQLTDIQPIKQGNRITENTAYLVLVDTSASMPAYFSEVQRILEGLFGFAGAKDKMAVFAVSNQLQLVKDFLSNDSSDKVTKTIENALTLDAKTGSCLYSGIREAYDLGRAASDIPSRRVIVLITDGGVEGDCLSSADLKDYLDVDRLPVYYLILGQPDSTDEDFKKAADQIAEKTGGQSFVNNKGNELFAQFKASQENGMILKLRCEDFKALNLQANLTVSWQGDQGEIRDKARFTATPAEENRAGLNNQQTLRTSYYGVMVILLPMILSLAVILVIGWVLITKGERSL
ncbi:vWA domain-containing protein [Desulfosporosinus orientis]|nr:vWA domain-containing protein [Desulfosporosinus orientis]